MNIISQFNQFLVKNFNDFLKKFFNTSNYWNKSSDINNYVSFMNGLDNFSTSLNKNIIIAYFNYIDDEFFKSSYRKNFCESKGFYERKDLVTMFGPISFKRRYYYDKKTKERFFFVDLFLGLKKRKRFDPIVCSEIVNKATEYSYSKSGKLIAEKIGNKFNNYFNISRASARNVVIDFDPIIEQHEESKRIERLYVMLDEKFIASQFNNGDDHMIKAAVIFENTQLEYKFKRNPDSMDRYRLVNSHVCASITNNLLKDTVDFIYNTYDINYLKEIYFMGDCATWITNFPRSCWFEFNQDTKVKFSMDNFHFTQALKLLTTNKEPNWYNSLYKLVLNNDKKMFKFACEQFIKLHPDRKETIISKMNYILNNWSYRQFYQSYQFLKCSMESHISHIFADLFSARPKAYSKHGLEKLLTLRLLKVNGYDLKQVYLSSFNKINVQHTSAVYNNIHNLNLDYHTNESSFEKEYKTMFPFDTPNEISV